MSWIHYFINWVPPFVISLVGIFLNIIEIGLLISNRKTKSPFHLTLISLAFADLTFATGTFTFLIFWQTIPHVYVFPWFAIGYFLTTSSSVFSSALHMLFIAIQRLFAVLYPIQFSVWITRRISVLTVILLWVFSVAAGSLAVFSSGVFTKFAQHFPAVVGVAIAVCYAIINYRMITKRRISVSGPSSQNREILLYSICITTAFFITVLPYVIYDYIHKSFKHIPPYLLNLLLLQVVLDPSIYFLFNCCRRKSRFLCGNVSCCNHANIETVHQNAEPRTS